MKFSKACLMFSLLSYSLSPRYDLPVLDDKTKKFHQTVTCHNCGESGHKSYQCPKVTPSSVPSVVTTGGNTMEVKVHALYYCDYYHIT